MGFRRDSKRISKKISKFKIEKIGKEKDVSSLTGYGVGAIHGEFTLYTIKPEKGNSRKVKKIEEEIEDSKHKLTLYLSTTLYNRYNKIYAMLEK